MFPLINFRRRFTLKLDNRLSARQQNLQSILCLLDENKSLSAKQLAHLTGLSIVSINKLLDIINSHSHLITTSYLSTRGRRAKNYQLNYAAYHLGIVQLIESNNQIKATFFLTDLAGNVQYQKFNDPKITSLKQLTSFIQQETIQNQPQKIIIGIPGAELNGLLEISDIKALQGINLATAIKAATDIETIVVNDANASTFGAATALHENNNIAVGIYFPNNFGPGVGIVINNQLINGADGLAGEIEYSTVDSALASERIRQHVQNIISLLNPNLMLVYADKLGLNASQIEQIKQTLQHNLPLHHQYRLDFDRDFEKDCLIGLTTIGRKNILHNLSTD